MTDCMMDDRGVEEATIAMGLRDLEGILSGLTRALVLRAHLGRLLSQHAQRLGLGSGAPSHTCLVTGLGWLS